MPGYYQPYKFYGQKYYSNIALKWDKNILVEIWLSVSKTNASEIIDKNSVNVISIMRKKKYLIT